MMKAAVLQQFGQPLALADVAVPTPAADEVLLQTQACGIDGTDLKLCAGFGYTPQLPFIMGHEIAGIVRAVGSGVTDFAPGDRVIVYNFLFCGRCVYCLTQREQLCLNMRGVMGVLQRHGGYAEYVAVPAQQLVPIPPSVAWEDAAVCCDALLTAIHALERSRLRLGETVIVIGVGGVGSVLVQLARLAGAQVIAVDHDARRADWAAENGAHVFVDSSAEPDLAQKLRALTDGLGAACVIDVVGKQATMHAAFNSLQRAGRLVIVGYTPDHFPVPGKQLAQNELEIIGTRAGRRSDLSAALNLLAAGQLKSIVRYRYPLAAVNEALAHLRAGGALGRIVLTYHA
ncbi:MAG: zinc-binding dehydrogenase [Chloroflexi bacterium]|nr:zinc-binding dehydrogenase [Chloroflexota bacterium]